MKRAGPEGYSIVLPTGWHRIPIRSGTRTAIHDLTGQLFAQFPRNLTHGPLAPYRRAVDERLTDIARQARRAGGIDLYLPLEPVHGTAVPASFIVSTGTPSALGAPDPCRFLDQMTAEVAEAEPVTLDGSPGLRIEHVTPANHESGADVGTLCIDYVIPLPGNRDCLLVAAFSTPGDGNPESEFTKLLSHVFDAIMHTFRWTASRVRGEQ